MAKYNLKILQCEHLKILNIWSFSIAYMTGANRWVSLVFMYFQRNWNLKKRWAKWIDTSVTAVQIVKKEEKLGKEKQKTARDNK